MSTGFVEAAAEVDWLDRAVRQPDAALTGVRPWLDARAVSGERHVLARHVAALALVERGELAEARRHVVAGIATATRLGMPRRGAQQRVTLAWIELEGGDVAACQAQLDAAAPELDGHDRVRLTCLRGLAHVQADEFEEAVTALGRVLPDLRRHGDRRWEANALVGRGLSWLYRNRPAEAEADLAAAEQLLRDAGRHKRAAACRHNRGCVALRAGDLVGALRLFDEAITSGLDTSARPEVLVDRAEALAAAGLTCRATKEMQRAARILSRNGRTLRLAETELALAACALRDGDRETTLAAAGRARRSFRAHRRPGWAALASVRWWQAKIATGVHSRWTLVAARRAALAAEAHGWTAEAAELSLAAGRAAWRAGRHGTARALLTSAASAREDRAAPVAHRMVAWWAQALVAEIDAGDRGDLGPVFGACLRAFDIVDGYATAIASFELRVRTFGLLAELADCAIRAAVRSGDAELVLRWAEQHRACALSPRPLSPPSGPALRSALVELRAAVAASGFGDAEQVRAAHSRVASLERRVRDRALVVEGTAGPARVDLDFREIVAELGGSVLVSYTIHDGQLMLVSVVDGRIRCHGVGSVDEVAAEVPRLRQLLSRQARSISPRVVAEFADGARRCAETIQQQVLGPVLDELRDRALVVVPTGPLHLLAWNRLPACRGRSVVVAPSLRCWRRAAEDARQASRGSAVWVAGPGLDHATREVTALQSAHGGRLMIGADATAERVRAAMDGASVAHIAAHGTFRDDQPLLSSIGVADGPLYGHDLNRLHRSPTTVVLSACEAGCSTVSRGDELSGLAAILLSRGTVTVIASVVPVPDERTAAVMVSLHRELRAGATPATALARAQTEHDESGFLCLGHGGR
ncbi:CHAT domain-containing protein [Allosaccharopolyspora coralli]|uniref:CHAT domain-containing protein n=1 Tax=Allosaccharopolyspora coralli TaxID=2665642 RepID=A0A5Q3QEN9_9PSEU|nr:CHAT domain-containing protein [Allosaccharopolyspora coralli]QGK71694.1 CHAT domain-containing protein [Allosaccharopolyspora coralli]